MMIKRIVLATLISWGLIACGGGGGGDDPAPPANNPPGPIQSQTGVWEQSNWDNAVWE